MLNIIVSSELLNKQTMANIQMQMTSLDTHCQIECQPLISKNSSEVQINFQHYFSSNTVNTQPTLSNCCAKLHRIQEKYHQISTEPLLHQYIRKAAGIYPRTPVMQPLHITKIFAKNIHKFLKTNRTNEPHGTWLPIWQMLPFPDSGAHIKILEELEKSNNVDVIYIDFAKAIDKFDNGILFKPTQKNGNQW